MTKNIKPKKLSTEEAEAAKKLKRQKWIAFWIAVYWISLFVPFISPYTKYPVYVVICGGKLPIIGTKFAAAYSYTKPGEPFYELTPLHDQLFCTEEQAQAAGYNNRNSNP